jgi:outer membrane receptor protein involved in Fe transport
MARAGLPCVATAAAALLPQAALAQATGGAGSEVNLPSVNIVGTSPLLGSGIDRNKLPAETNVLNGADIARQGTPDALRALNDQVAGVNLDSASGNPDQPTLLYHGFEASPLQGTPQGLAVYVNGVRFNDPFGDTVNWDLIPSIAISQLNLEGPNPVFGLNALGGALSVQLKDGFGYQGGEAYLYGGSFGRVEGDIQYGKQAGNFSTYVAGTVRHQDGWRDLQSSDIQNFYGDIGWRGERVEAHLNLTLANSVLNGPGTSPVELLAADPAAQFTAPNVIANRYLQATLQGNYKVTDTTSVQALAYYRYLLQRVINGNVPSAAPCNDGSGLLCSDPGTYGTTRGGAPIPDFLGGGPYSEEDLQTTNTNAYGASVQVTNTNEVLGRANHLVAGFSFDGAQTGFSATALLGGLTPDRAFVGPGVAIDEPGTNTPVRLAVSDAYYGFYVSDTLNVTKRLAVTVSGRFNAAEIDLADQGGGALTGQHTYNRFNPAAGAAYTVAPWLTAYAGYSEANRAPTPAELSCAGPNDSCSLANFFTGDPNLKQVVAHSWEAGVRGTIRPGDGVRVTYDLSLFRTTLDDDIAFVNAVTLNRAFFQNVGQTRRQGVDAGVQLRTPRWLAYVDYNYTEATYQSTFSESAGSNPAADANGNITVRPGNRLPGVPANQLKFGVYYKVTDKWTVGAVGVYQSGQYLFGDPSNLTPRLPGFVTLNLNTQYQVTPDVQLFGLIENVNDARYYTYGTFSPTSAVFLAQAPNAANPRSYSPAAPIGGFGGVRVRF